MDMLTYQTLFLSYVVVRSVPNAFRTNSLNMLSSNGVYWKTRHVPLFLCHYLYRRIILCNIKNNIVSVHDTHDNAEITRQKLSIRKMNLTNFCKVRCFEISLELPVMLRYVAMNVLCGKIFKNLIGGDLYKHTRVIPKSTSDWLVKINALS